MTNCCRLDFTIEEVSLNFNLKENDGLGFQIDNQYVIAEGGSYKPLIEKPQINYHVLQSGNNTYEYLGVEPTIIDITEQDIDNIIFGG